MSVIVQCWRFNEEFAKAETEFKKFRAQNSTLENEIK